MKVAVVGAGIAGTAAAWALRRAGAEGIVFRGRPGATALYSGALDLTPWDAPEPEAALSPEILAFAAALDAWTVGAAPTRVATHEGVLRRARGRDTALLDLVPLEGRRVAIADAGIESFPAAAFARSLGSSAWATRTKTRFDRVAVPGMVDGAERRIPAYDLARLHDAPERVSRLAECLAKADRSADAWLLGPWLGTTVGSADALREALGRAVGETTSPPGGPSGARFESARDALFGSVGADVRKRTVVSVERSGAGWAVESASPGGSDTLHVDAVILAIGGVVSGGVVLGGGTVGGALRTSVRAPLLVGASGAPLEASAGSGPDWVATGLEALERVGVLADGAAARGCSRMFVAGDVVADRPRTALEAVRSGIEAAAMASRPT